MHGAITRGERHRTVGGAYGSTVILQYGQQSSNNAVKQPISQVAVLRATGVQGSRFKGQPRNPVGAARCSRLARSIEKSVVDGRVANVPELRDLIAGYKGHLMRKAPGCRRLHPIPPPDRTWRLENAVRTETPLSTARDRRPDSGHRLGALRVDPRVLAIFQVARPSPLWTTLH